MTVLTAPDIIIRPALLRPESRFCGSSRGLYGSRVVISSKVDRVIWRRPGDVAL